MTTYSEKIGSKKATANILMATMFALVFCACTPTIFSGLDKNGKAEIDVNRLHQFKLRAQRTYTYNVEMVARGETINGIMAARYTKDNDELRIVLTTVFGVTMIDAVITSDSMTFYKCPEQMKQKIILAVLQKDLRSIFGLNIQGSKAEAKIYSNSDKSRYGYTIKNEYGNTNILTDEKKKKAVVVECGSGIKSSTTRFDYEDYAIEPSCIRLTHEKLGVSMKLWPMKNQ